MHIRKATEKDIPDINRLLHQVLTIHHEGRPDLFKQNCKKYTESELKTILQDNQKPVFLAIDRAGNTLGYAFCVLETYHNDNIQTDRKELYIDDLCIESFMRGKHVGKNLYQYILDFAKEIGCYRVILNVWTCNPNAEAFYQAMGMKPYKTGMEVIL
ncbi:MAG: GNAT family N-acetyltransferase [Ruminococcus sp.]|nr:GNAT family N-acetyltransferase [Ruminococcus sp.]